MSDATPAEPVVLIKKYSNRRLYDTRTSRYITLEELAAIIQGGASVRVEDAKTGQDLTRAVLTQAILERQERLDLVPVELLHTLIRVQGTLQQVPFATFLASLSRQFAQSGALWAQQFSSLFGGMTGFPGASGSAASAVPPAQQAPPEPAASEPARKRGREKKAANPDLSELKDLKNRMEELLKKLGQ